MALTITEALAEIKTTGKRIESKRTYITGNLARQFGIKDPLASDGGSVEVIKRERQAVTDLETRIVVLRRGISRANEKNEITIGDMSMSISDWLVWRRDVMPDRRGFLNDVRAKLHAIRENAKRQSAAIVTAGAVAPAPNDIEIYVDEAALAKDIELLVQIEGELDGQLSLKNATTQIVEE